MGFLGELRVQATVDSLRTVTDFVQSLGRRLNLGEKTLFQLELAVDGASPSIRTAYDLLTSTPLSKPA
jgi:hypothetical protein